MGDVGSGYLGYLLGMLMLVTSSGEGLSPWLWLVLMCLLLADTAVVLIRRALRGENLAQAHASHSYQILSRRWGSHGAVSVLWLAALLVWSLPLGFLAQTNSGGSSFLLFWLALLPPAAVATLLGAGVDE
jgi:Fuc2NAc and GlcNAc transferase